MPRSNIPPQIPPAPFAPPVELCHLHARDFLIIPEASNELSLDVLQEFINVVVGVVDVDVQIPALLQHAVARVGVGVNREWHEGIVVHRFQAYETMPEGFFGRFEEPFGDHAALEVAEVVVMLDPEISDEMAVVVLEIVLEYLDQEFAGKVRDCRRLGLRMLSLHMPGLRVLRLRH